jgi:hypothetical protein
VATQSRNHSPLPKWLQQTNMLVEQTAMATTTEEAELVKAIRRE